MHDLSIIIVSYGSAAFLPPCFDSIRERAGDLSYEVVVADNDPTEEVAELIRSRYPWVRHVRCSNHGFAHANNRGIRAAQARHVLLLNPDTELIDGTLARLVALLDRSPDVGLVGVRQQLPGGELAPTMRRFPSPLRELATMAGVERWPGPLRELGERILDPAPYDRETDCDWVSGSFMLLRGEALEVAGVLDERFFLFGEETDLCRRVRLAGYRVLHTPAMTIIHHAGKAGVNARLTAQMAFARRQYADKHMTGSRRWAYLAAVVLRHAVRALAHAGAADRRQAELAAVTAIARGRSSFAAPPAVAIRED